MSYGIRIAYKASLKLRIKTKNEIHTTGTLDYISLDIKKYNVTFNCKFS